MARFPSRVRVGHLTYEISCVPRKEIERLPEDKYECDGYTWHEKGQIWVAAELNLEQRQETLMHEIEHAVVHVAFPSEPAWLKRNEENYVERTAGPRLQAFRDNPGVRKYLFENR